MINLFHINNYKINTKNFSNLLHDGVVSKFEEKICNYVGAKYAVSLNSATNAIFLTLLNKDTKVSIPSMIPPVVVNAIKTSNNDFEFIDNTEWIGDSYILHKFNDYKIVDSAQKLEKNQFNKECNPNDLMIFSFYPTKPIGSCDGGMIVSNDLDKITFLKELALNGMSYNKNNWDREIKHFGYKMYINSIQAYIGLKNFEKYEKKLQNLKYIRNFYNESFNLNNTSNHLYRIEVNNREELMSFLKKNNISSGIHYKTCHTIPLYGKENLNCPNSVEKSDKTLSIPFHESLTKNEIKHIIKTIKKF
jgi:UDP-4-amino-4,6-dideoxy-L-N-acetyl-beta-L-altrosamine transaminase